MSTEPRGTLVWVQLVYHFFPFQSLLVSEGERSPNSELLDLELATRDYKPRAMAEKVAAGLSLNECSDDAWRFRRVLDEREITGIRSL